LRRERHAIEAGLKQRLQRNGLPHLHRADNHSAREKRRNIVEGCQTRMLKRLGAHVADVGVNASVDVVEQIPA
jgi:hypothetical protein